MKLSTWDYVNSLIMAEWPKNWTSPYSQTPQTVSNKEQVQNPQREIRLVWPGLKVIWWACKVNTNLEDSSLLSIISIMLLFCHRRELWRGIILGMKLIFRFWRGGQVWWPNRAAPIGGTLHSNTDTHCQRAIGRLDWFTPWLYGFEKLSLEVEKALPYRFKYSSLSWLSSIVGKFKPNFFFSVAVTELARETVKSKV